MPSRFHEGARRSWPLDRKAARRRHGLDGRSAIVTGIPTARPGHHLYDCRHDLGSAWLGSFSAWGVTGISFGILLVCRWSRWYALVFVGLFGIR